MIERVDVEELEKAKETFVTKKKGDVRDIFEFFLL